MYWQYQQCTQVVGHTKGIWTLREQLGTSALGGHSKRTRGHDHLRHSGTRALRALRQLGIQAIGHSGTRGIYFADSNINIS